MQTFSWPDHCHAKRFSPLFAPIEDMSKEDDADPVLMTMTEIYQRHREVVEALKQRVADAEARLFKVERLIAVRRQIACQRTDSPPRKKQRSEPHVDPMLPEHWTTSPKQVSQCVLRQESPKQSTPQNVRTELEELFPTTKAVHRKPQTVERHPRALGIVPAEPENSFPIQSTPAEYWSVKF